MKTKNFYFTLAILILILSSCHRPDDNFIERNDDDGDGVINVIDECERTPLGVPVDSVGCPLED